VRITQWLKILSSEGGSDLYLSTGAPPCAKFQGQLKPIDSQIMQPGEIKDIAYEIMDATQIAEFEKELEMNLATSISGYGRFRVNIFMQRNEVGIVARNIVADIPQWQDLRLPAILPEVVMRKRGLVLFVGATGSGKSTSLAALIDYRNSNSSGHIVTIEDPVEYVHSHKTEERRNQLLMDLSLNIQGIISQRLIPTVDGKRCAAIEVLLGTPMIADLVLRGDIDGIKEVMQKSENIGMKTFDTALLELYQEGLITEEEALRNADSPNNVRLKIKFAKEEGDAEGGPMGLSLESIEEEDQGQVF
jgi:twitching motility protein PilU